MERFLEKCKKIEDIFLGGVLGLLLDVFYVQNIQVVPRMYQKMRFFPSHPCGGRTFCSPKRYQKASRGREIGIYGKCKVLLSATGRTAFIVAFLFCAN